MEGNINLTREKLSLLLALQCRKKELSISSIIYRDFQRLTLDVIASSVFIYKTDVFNNKADVFLENLEKMFRNLDIVTADLRVKIESLIASKY